MKINFFKNKMLFALLVLIPLSGNAEVVGGHDRQRLGLIFFDLLETSFSNTPISITTDYFPNKLAVTDANKATIQLFDVLVEEGWLKKRSTTIDIGTQGPLVTQAFEYTVNSERKNTYIPTGEIKVQQITSIRALSGLDDTSAYEIQFMWTFVNPAPWIWAPNLDDHPSIVLMKTALQTPQEAFVRVEWINEDWVLETLPDFF